MKAPIVVFFSSAFQGELLKKFAAAYRMFSDMDDHVPWQTQIHPSSFWMTDLVRNEHVAMVDGSACDKL